MPTYQVKFETQYCWNLFAKRAGIILDPFRLKLIKFPSYEVETKKISKRSPSTDDGFNWEMYYTNMPVFSKEKGWYVDLKIDIPDDNLDKFVDIHKCEITGDKSFWYSHRHHRYKGKAYHSTLELRNRFPIYIPSKNRADCCKTAQSLLEMGIDDFYIIVEESQYEDYLRYYESKNLLILPQRFFDEYEVEPTFHDIPNRSYGSGPARNFSHWHANQNGYKWNYLLDDNTHGFVRFAPGNFRIPVKTPVMFALFEDFVTRWSNVPMASMNYR